MSEKPTHQSGPICGAMPCSAFVATANTGHMANYHEAETIWDAVAGFVSRSDGLLGHLLGDWDDAVKGELNFPVLELLTRPDGMDEDETWSWMDTHGVADYFDVESPPFQVAGREVAKVKVRWQWEEGQAPLKITALEIQPNVEHTQSDRLSALSLVLPRTFLQSSFEAPARSDLWCCVLLCW